MPRCLWYEARRLRVMSACFEEACLGRGRALFLPLLRAPAGRSALVAADPTAMVWHLNWRRPSAGSLGRAAGPALLALRRALSRWLGVARHRLEAGDLPEMGGEKSPFWDSVKRATRKEVKPRNFPQPRNSTDSTTTDKPPPNTPSETTYASLNPTCWAAITASCRTNTKRNRCWWNSTFPWCGRAG